MNRQIPPLPSKSWEIFAFARQILGESGMYRIFHIERTQMYRWGRSPEVEESRRNPIDRVSRLLTEMSECGGAEGRHVAKIALNLMSRECGFRVVDTEQPEPVTDEPRAEFLDLYNRLHELQTSAQRHDDPLVVEMHADTVAKSLSAFLMSYTADHQTRDGDVRFALSESKTPSLWQRFKNWL